MDIKEQLEYLSAYIGFNRGVGHTTLLKEGSNNYDRDHFVIAHDSRMAGQLCKGTRGISVSKERLERLRGATLPIAIDNFALQIIFDAALIEIDRLEAELKEVKEKEKTDA